MYQVVIAATLAVVLISIWATFTWLVRRDRGKVKLSETEIAMRRFREQLKDVEVALATAMRPAFARLSAALVGLNRAMEEAGFERED